MNSNPNLSERPGPSEAPEHMLTYIEKVAPGDVRDTLESQGERTAAYLRAIPDERTLESYQPGKWTVREVLGHINDTERVFVFRALWFARGFEAPLPGFDQNVAVAAAGSNSRSWSSLVDEFVGVRAATTSLFRELPDEAWSRQGVASERVVSVKALAFISAGHVEHHLRVLRERYLV